MGLKPGEDYDETSVKKLRYGHLMIMADQDHDGSHIKGLVINFLHHFWPTLLNVPGFLQQFITPIIKASKGKKSKTFFTLPEYEAWKESTGNDAKGWKIKYYKGLGTSTSAEAKEYFGNLDMHEVHFGKLEDDVDVLVVDDDDDEEEDVDMMEFEGSEQQSKPAKKTSGGELIEMAFSKSKVEDRKEWLGTFQKDTFLNYAEAQKQGVRFSDFVNKELILFSNADNARSIPHVLDGFKPSQRKILFACFKRKLKGEIKVAQLAGYISEHSAYHHGEASLQGAIVGMAQSFVGSNNINLLTPSGQFGTRRMGGKDAASPRYIFTKLEKITRAIFHPDDDAILTYLNDDGLSIEPENYMPVIPMVLVNGSDGIGTGWSSSTPNYCPRQVIANLRRRLKGEELEKMVPHYSGFNGEMVAETGKREGSFIVRGKIERTNDTTLMITELPIKKWTQDYKMFLEGLMLGDASSKTTAAKKGKDDEDDADGGGKKKAKSAIAIQDFKENHTDSTVSFTITASKDAIDSYEKEKDGLIGKFKLKTTISTSNMQLFNEQGRIIKYNAPEDILEEFYRVRVDFYEKRKAHLLEILRKERLMLSNKARFVEEVCSGELIVSNRKRSELLDELKERGYDLMSKDDEKKSSDNADGSDDEDEEEDNTSYAELAKGYEYLLGMKIWTLTFEKSEKLRAELEVKTQEVADLEATPPSTLWWNDLDAIEDAMDERDEEMAAAVAEEKRQQTKSKKSQTKKTSKKTKGKGRKKKADEWDSDMEDSDEDDDGMMSDSDDDDFGGYASKKKKASAKGAGGAKSKKVREAPPAFAAAPNARYSPKKAASKKAAPAAKKVAASAKPTAAGKKKVEAKPVQKPEPVDDDGFNSDDASDSDESSVGLAAKLGRKLMVSPPPKSIKVDTASDIESDDDDDEDFGASKKRPSPKNSDAEATPSTKAKPAKKPKKAAAAKKPAAKKAAPAKKKKTTSVCDLSDSEMSFAGDSDDDDSAAEDEVMEVAPRARSRRANVVRKTYTLSDSEESDAESDFSFDD